MTEEAPPALYQHCCVVFEKMHKAARPEKIENIPTLVYEGYLTRLFNELNMATPYYTTVMRRLKAMGCVRQLSRGGGSTPTRWELVEEPGWDAFEVIDERRVLADTKLGQATSNIRALIKRISELETRVEILESEREVQVEAS
jgi:hypothetical protein